MRVYVETNFVFELALRQEELASCQEILRLAEKEEIELVIPAYSLVEPHETLRRRHQKRLDLSEELLREVRQLARTKEFAHTQDNADQFQALLAGSLDVELQSLHSMTEFLSHRARVLSLDSAIILSSFELQQRLDLSPQDSLVYASVVHDLGSRQRADSIFLIRDKHFDRNEIDEELGRLGCTRIRRFEDGRDYLAAQLRPPAPS